MYTCTCCSRGLACAVCDNGVAAVLFMPSAVVVNVVVDWSTSSSSSATVSRWSSASVDILGRVCASQHGHNSPHSLTTTASYLASAIAHGRNRDENSHD